MKTKKLATFLFSLLFCSISLGQSTTLTGSIKDARTGETLPGVTVAVKGTSAGTVSNTNGRYQISVEPGAVLIVSFVGYSTREIPVNGRSTIDITLSDDATQLEDIVIVGYGTQTQEKLTGSLTSVKGELLKSVPVASVDQALQGNIAGLQATAATGQPGAAAEIRIRGIGSINSSSEPLFVVDGVPVVSSSSTEFNDDNPGSSTGGPLSSIPSSDIANITVLKDASATAIYGARAANGVILITTKSGTTGKPKVSISIREGISAPTPFIKTLNAEEYQEFYIESSMNASPQSNTYAATREEALKALQNLFKEAYDSDGNLIIDNSNYWPDAIVRWGLTQNYDASVSGGLKNLRYFSSVSYMDQESQVIGSGFDRLSTRLNLNVDISPRMTVQNNLSVALSNQLGNPSTTRWDNPLWLSLVLPPLLPIYDANGNPNEAFQDYYGSSDVGGRNPLRVVEYNIDAKKTMRITDNLNFTFDLTKDLIWKSTFNIDLIQFNERAYNSPLVGDGFRVGGEDAESSTTRTAWITTHTLDYSHNFNGKHDVSGLVGFEASKNTIEQFDATGQGFPQASLTNLESTGTPVSIGGQRSAYSFLSYFSRGSYTYDSKYSLTGSLRTDGSSRFGANNKFGLFWSIGGAWNISKEDFIKSVSFIDNLKLRASYGVLGNANYGPGLTSEDERNFASIALLSAQNSYLNETTFTLQNYANPDLTWEKQGNLNIGIDFSILKRLSGTIEYFNRQSNELLLNVPLSRTTGIDETVENYGGMVNSGLELTFDLSIYRTKDWNISVGFNTTILNNEITNLGSDFNDDTKRRAVGHDFQEYYLLPWAGVDPLTGQGVYHKVDDDGNILDQLTGSLSETSRVFTGKSASPDHYGGFNLGITYKNLSLQTQFTYSAGRYLYANGLRFFADGAKSPRNAVKAFYDQRWQQVGDQAAVPKAAWRGSSDGNQPNSERWLYDGTYVRLRNMTLAYNFGEKVLSTINISSCRVYMNLLNYWTWTKEDLLFDPEQRTNGVANVFIQVPQTISFGIDLTI